MTPDRFEQLRELVLAAADLPAAERPGFLKRACAGDAELLAGAERLLEHDTGTNHSFSADLESPLLEDPDSIGRYAVKRRLGAGGMGVVFLAEDPNLSRLVAIKLLPEWVVSDTDAHVHLREEARLLAKLNHPNIATIYSLEFDGPGAFLTMEYIDGDSLAARVVRGALPLDEALPVLHTIAGALEAAHERSVVHRDLKPQNVMVSSDGVVKVLDFGLARIVDDDRTVGPLETPSRRHARPGDTGSPKSWSSAGTPGYMSPERVLGSADDVAGDIWSFGCVAFECATGMKAFGGSREQRLHATVHEPAPMSVLPKDVPDPLRRIIERCLAKHPADRLPNMRGVRRELETLIESREIARLQGRDEEPPSTVRGLPRYLTSFVGREAEQAAVSRLVREHRLVTLVGFGGTGKTRLAVETTRAESVDAVWIDLSAVGDPDQVVMSMLAGVGIASPGVEPVSRLVGNLSRTPRTLVIDNCEHHTATVAEIVSRVLTESPTSRVLATSREPIGLDGEMVFEVLPLPLSAGSDGSAPAVDLFVSRLRAAGHATPASGAQQALVSDICRRLDGVPLALEIAASQVDALTLEELSDRLDQRLEFSRTSREPRHRSLRSVIDGSFSTLNPAEQSMIARMSVLPGSWTLGAAEAIGLGDADATWQSFERVKALVRKSLVQRMPETDSGGRSRYRMLETVREYARERLDSGPDGDPARCAALSYYRNLFDRARIVGPEARKWLERYAIEEENVASVLDSTLPDLAPRPFAELVASLSPIRSRLGRWRRVLQDAERAEAGLEASGESRSALAIRLMQSRSEVLTNNGRPTEAVAIAQRSESVAREIGHRALQGRAIGLQGNAERYLDRNPAALELYDRYITEFAGDVPPEELSGNRFNRAVLYLHTGRIEEADREFRECLEIKKEIGDLYGTSQLVNAVGVIHAYRGEFEDAQAYYERAYALKTELDDAPGLVHACSNLSRVMLNRFRSLDEDRELIERSLAYCSEGIALATEMGNRGNLATLYFSRCSALSILGDLEGAETAAREGLAVAEEVKSRSYAAMGHDTLARLAILQEDPAKVWRHGVAAYRGFLESTVSAVYQPLRTMAYGRSGLGDPRGAVLLLAASKRSATDHGAQLATRLEEADETLRVKERAKLTPEAYEEAWRLGTETETAAVLDLFEES